MPLNEEDLLPMLGGSPEFMTTHWTVVLSARGNSGTEAEAAVEQLCRGYWYPLYAYLRRRGCTPHDAQDHTQEFFSRLLEKRFLDSVDRNKGRFRSFLLASLNHFLSNERDRAQAAKRGGGRQVISLDEQAAEDRYKLEPASEMTAEKIFEQRWALTVLDRALARLAEELRREGKGGLFDRLKVHLEGETTAGDYAAMAAELKLSVGAITVAVHRLRRRYRDLVRAEVAATVGSAEEIDEEMQHLRTVLC